MALAAILQTVNIPNMASNATVLDMSAPTFRLEDPAHRHFEVQAFYLVHGAGIRTGAVLGMQAMLRQLDLEGLPPVIHFEWIAIAYDSSGRLIRRGNFVTARDEELVFDSEQLLGSDGPRTLTGSVYLEIEAVVFERPPVSMHHTARNFNGIYFNFRRGNFITGVHLYHSVTRYSVLRTFAYYAKRLARESLLRFQSAFSETHSHGAWKADAIGAGVVHAGSQPGAAALLVMHNDNPFPGVSALFEFRRHPDQVRHCALPALGRRATLELELDGANHQDLRQWTQVLCVRPPLGQGRFLAGEKFPDGSFCLDHTYFQQPRGSTWGKAGEVRFFPKSILSETVIGPSNPWLCLHNDEVRSEIALCNQFFPSDAYEYDLRIFDEAGRLTLHTPGAARVGPYGMTTLDISAALDALGIRDFRGTYVIGYGRGSSADQLPSRLHAQGIYRFRDGYWNGVQSDASIWSSPAVPVAEIEQLSGVRIRHRQLWYALVVESVHLETLLSLANLSYSLDYDQTQTLLITLCAGAKTLAETEVTLPPFGSTLLTVAELFPEHFPADGATRYRSIKVFPRTGKTYCASFLMRERVTRRFVLEHVLQMPKFAHEK